MGGLRKEIWEPDSSVTEDEYYKKRDDYHQTFYKRESVRKVYITEHNWLIRNDSVLQHYDHLAVSLLSGTYTAYKAEENVLNNGGSWAEAKQAYENAK